MNVDIQVSSFESSGQHILFVCQLKDTKSGQTVTHKVGFDVLFNLHKAI